MVIKLVGENKELKQYEQTQNRENVVGEVFNLG